MITIRTSGCARLRLRAMFSLSTILAAGFATPGLAQTGTAPYLNVDGNGVDLTDGSFDFSLLEGWIGSGPGEMQLISYEDGESNWPSYYITQNKAGSTYTIAVRLGKTSDKFVGTGTTLTSSYATGATLSFTPAGTYVYRYLDGTKIEFVNSFVISGPSNMCSTYTQTGCQVLASALTRSDGLQISYTWTRNRNCQPVIGGSCTFARRLSKVSNNAGYAIEFTFVNNSVPPQSNPSPAWFQRATAQFTNANAGSSPWPTVTYAYPSSTVRTVTTPGGKAWRMTSAAGKLVGIKRPGAVSDTTIISYGANGVSLVINDGITTGYNRTLSGNTATMVMTDALSNQSTIVSDMTKYRPTAVTDPLSKTTSYTYDSLGRPMEVTAPEGNKVQYAYDARGNVTTTTIKAKPASGLADIVNMASFDATCANVLTCNSPNWTKDAKGAQTDYTYDAATGLMLTATLPAPTTGATRPQIRYGYVAVAGVTMPTSMSACQTGASCVGTTDEVKTTIGYNTNILPVSMASGAGDGSLTATTTITYDPIGNMLTADGPLAGTADTATLRWSLDRERVGVISPDPDGGGSLKRRATKATYNADGQPTVIEMGTANGTTDPDWAAFVSLQQANATYDANARKVKDTVTAGGTTYQVAQYSYDAVGRVDCTALRMNTATWGSLPSSACTLGATGTAGPDRIGKTIYDALGRAIKVQSAFGTAEQFDDATSTYSDNGQLVALTDAEANRTTYEYDGFDRLAKTRYPVATQGANASSTTDYEQLTYDANGHVTQRRLRDAQNIGYGYDNLDRLASKNLPGSEPDVTYGYDNLGRLVGANQTGNTLAFTYDALGRNLTQSGPFGTMALQYDIAGRRTRLTWPDAFYITYDYLVTGEVTHIRENGAVLGVGVLATYTYDDQGRRTSLTRGNGTATAYTHDDMSRLASQVSNLSGTTDDLTLGFSYNPAGQIATSTRSNDAYAWGQHYNVDRPYAVNGLNQLTSAGVTALGYDARGNLTSSGISSYGYSSENMLTSGPGGVALAYDPLLRLYQTTGAATTRFSYDGMALTGEYTGGGALTKRYVHGPSSDEPLVWYEGSGTTDRRWLHADERGSIIAVSNAGGAMTTINTYDEYGIPASGNSGRFQYTGQTWLPELGMYHYKARIYSPTLGRLMQTDPIGYGGGMNLYNYVGSDPVNFIDPTGLGRVCYTVNLPSTDSGGTITTQSRRECVNLPDYIPGFATGGSSGGGTGGLARLDTTLRCAGVAGDVIAMSYVHGRPINTDIERAALNQFLSGDNTTMTFGSILLEYTTEFTRGGTQNIGRTVPDRQSYDPTGSFRRRVFFGNSNGNSNFDHLLGQATVIFDSSGVAIGVEDTYDYNYREDYAEIVKLGMAVARYAQETCSGSRAGGFRIVAGIGR